MDKRKSQALDAMWASRAGAYLDIAEVIMVALDREGRVTLINRKGREVLGYSAGELVGRSWFETCIPEGSRDGVRSVFAQIMTGQVDPVEYHENLVMAKDGRERLVAWHNAILRDEPGRIAGTLSSGEDITERRHVEDSLRASEARYRSLVEHMGEGVMQVDRDDRILLVNDRLCQMLGWTSRDLLGRIGHEVCCVDDAGRALIVEKNRLRCCGVSDVYETTMRRSDGTVIWVSISGSPLYGHGGDVIGSVGLITDITARKRVEDALRASEAFNQALIENSPIGISVRSRTGRLLSANAAWKRIWAIPDPVFAEDAARERHSLDFDDRDDYLGAHKEEVRRVYERGGQLLLPELRVAKARQGAAEWVSQHFYAIPGAEGTVDRVVILTEDITQRKRDEEERQRLQEELIHAHKMESVGRLAGGVAHDFNNQLQVVLGHAEMALAKLGPDHALRPDLEEICRAAGRSADLTSQLLAFARRQITSPRVVDINDAVKSVFTMLRRLIGEDIELRWEPSADLWHVRVDPTQIVQILVNLCVNARDAIGGSGRVVIKTANAVVDDTSVMDHAGVAPGVYAVLSVTDDGCGMESEVLAHIFEPFFTTKEVGQGVGLGLATVYGIVKQNQGFIHVTSEPDRGTAVKIYLPRVDGSTPDAAPAQPPDQVLPTGGETVLFVEDDAAILSMGKEMLTGLGYRVVATCSPDEAIRYAEGAESAIDLLISDVVMPQMNGREMARRIAALRPGVRCLFISGYAADVMTHRGVLDEGVRFMQKPFTLKDLAVRVREALGETA